MDKQLALQRYCALMEEIKLRVQVVSTCIYTPFLRPESSFETCFLQFRMICENIALACLVAHDDIPDTQTKWFQKSIDVPKMMRRLADLHPSFYPYPTRPVHEEDGTSS